MHHCNHSAPDFALNEHIVHLVAQMQVLAYHTQLAHWQTKGPWFPSWHEMFGSHYESLVEMIDTLAEHLRYRHGHLPGTLLQAIHHLNEPVFPKEHGDAILHHLLHLTQAVMVKSEQLMTLCAELNLQTTLDILIEQMRAFEKMVWFYHSTESCCNHKSSGCI
jgi:DNA-binding ferritin-like protein